MSFSCSYCIDSGIARRPKLNKTVVGSMAHYCILGQTSLDPATHRRETKHLLVRESYKYLLVLQENYDCVASGAPAAVYQVPDQRTPSLTPSTQQP